MTQDVEKPRIANATTVTEEHEDGPLVTPMMLDAAAEVLAEPYLGDGVYDVRGEVMTEIYRAMRLARRTLD